MPNSAEHRRMLDRWVPLPVTMSTASAVAGHPWIALGISAGYALSYVLSNDLDQISITTEEAEWIRTIVLIPFVAWSTLYARILQLLPAPRFMGRKKGHRGFWSHFPPVATPFKMAWFVLIPEYTVMNLLGIAVGRAHGPVAVGMLIGLMCGDTIHTIMDYLAYRKIKKKKT